MKTTMNKMQVGDVARVQSVNISGAMQRRLLDIGLIEGTRVECVHKGAFGDPTAFLIRGAVIAIRGDDSGKVVVGKEC